MTVPRMPKIAVAMCGQCGQYVNDESAIGGTCPEIGCITPNSRPSVMRKRLGWLCRLCDNNGRPQCFFLSYQAYRVHYREYHLEGGDKCPAD